MHMTKYLAHSVAVLTVFIGIALGEISYIPLAQNPHGIWNSDSLFLGGEIAVVDSSKPIIVTWKTNQGDALGELFFMVPNAGDSTISLFHNQSEAFPEESTAVNLGHYPAETKLFFMYMVTDTSEVFQSIISKKLYSGQNRSGTDPFVSERQGLVDFRWAVAGNVGDDTCEISFASVSKGDFRQVRFHISNTYLVR